MTLHNDDLRERVQGELLAVYTAGYDHEVADIAFHADRIIDLIRADERKRVHASIAARALSEPVVEAVRDRVKSIAVDPHIKDRYQMYAEMLLESMLAELGITESEDAK